MSNRKHSGIAYFRNKFSFMNAMIFAAGLGTRLRPLTNDRPKALVEVNGMPLLEIALRRLHRFGYTQVVVNVHHFAKLMIDFLQKVDLPGLQIHISEEQDALLDTGGGLKQAKPWLDQAPFLICNVDILNDLDLRAVYAQHLHANALATLLVRQRTTSRYLLFDESQQLCGWRNVKTGAEKWSRKSTTTDEAAFSGIHVVNPQIFDYMPDENIFSIIDVYLEAARYERIIGLNHDDSLWLDVGKPHTLQQAGELLKQIPLD